MVILLKNNAYIHLSNTSFYFIERPKFWEVNCENTTHDETIQELRLLKQRLVQIGLSVTYTEGNETLYVHKEGTEFKLEHDSTVVA